jgi:hypothetical protein
MEEAGRPWQSGVDYTLRVMAWPQDLFEPTPSPDEVRRQLEHVLASPEFARAARLRDLLAFVVGSVLDGREDRLVGARIAAEVFRRREFDPESDSIVRTEASRLRHRLHRYYGGSGRRARVLIVLGRGDYLPVFRYRRPAPWWRRPAAVAIASTVLAAVVLLLAVVAARMGA